ncbi:response regulator transcription factor [Rhodobacteraceae bacterium F11138]|nr:response regulator transcription factor [Rhodobacteraceae bacterium F11138]
MISIVVVDDHQLFREGVITLLDGSDDLQVIGQAGSASQAKRIIVEKKPDVVIMDISLGTENGIEVGRDLRATGSDFALLIVTMETAPQLFQVARKEAEVDGYVLKLDAFDELERAVRQVASGQKFISPTLASELAYANDADDGNDGLTPRELQVIVLVVEGYSSAQIGEQLGISKRTVDTYRANVREKLQISSSSELVRYAIRKGLVTA